MNRFDAKKKALDLKLYLMFDFVILRFIGKLHRYIKFLFYYIWCVYFSSINKCIEKHSDEIDIEIKKILA